MKGFYLSTINNLSLADRVMDLSIKFCAFERAVGGFGGKVTDSPFFIRIKNNKVSRSIYSRSSVRVRYPGFTREVMPRPREVSRPVIPLGASVRGLDFSSTLCGAWSVAIRSIVPSLSP